MLVWMLRLPVLVLVEVRMSFLLSNAVNHANPVIKFPVVHNEPTWCYSLNTQSERADGTYRRRKQDAKFACIVPGCGSEWKQPMIPKRRLTGGAGGANVVSWWTLSSIPDRLASFSDHTAVL